MLNDISEERIAFLRKIVGSIYSPRKIVGSKIEKVTLFLFIDQDIFIY